MSNHRVKYHPLPQERDPLVKGMFYYPSPEYSIPADDLCWHVPPSPNADFRCIRERNHPGKHRYQWSPTLKDHSHKQDISNCGIKGLQPNHTRKP